MRLVDSDSVAPASRSRAIALLAVATFAIGGCGSASSSDAIVKTVETFSRAVARGDAQTACNQLVPGFQAFPGKNVSCQSAMLLAVQQLTEQQKALLRAITVKSVSITGDTATATLLYGAQVQHAKLKQIAGQWRIERTGGS